MEKLNDEREKRCVFRCNNCKVYVITWYHCRKCQDFDLCISCFRSQGHPHVMVSIDPDADSDTSADNQNLHHQEARIESIKRCGKAMVHSAQCQDADCWYPHCEKMRRVHGHVKICKENFNGDCWCCEQMKALCYSHAYSCKDARCVFPYCESIKQKEMQQMSA